MELKLDLNERSETPPNWAVKALSECPMDSLWRYQDRFDLERLIGESLQLEPQHVLLTNGGDEAIQYLFADLPAQTPVIMPLPIFGFYREQSEVWPVKAIFVPSKADFSLDVEALFAAVEANPGNLTILTRPNNPTGEVLSRTTVVQLLRLCKEQGSTLLLDEAYAEFFEDPLVDLLDSYPNLIILRTFSKAYGLAGLRLGYLLNRGTVFQKLAPRILPYNIAAPSLWIGSNAMALQAREEVRQYAAQVARNRDRIQDQLRDWGLKVYASQANFIFLNLGRKRLEFAFSALSQLGVHTRRFSQESLAGCLRIAIPADPTWLERALAIVFNPNMLCLDVDGTLLDTRASFDALVIQLVEQFTGSTASEAEILAVRARGGFNDDFALTAELARLRGKTVAYETVAEAGTRLYFGGENEPGLHELETPIYKAGLLQRLAAKCKLALVTGRSRDELAVAKELLAAIGDAPRITIDDVQQGKPHPEGLYLAAEQTQCRRVWMLGDNPDDITAARAAGAMGIGVGTNKAALLEAGAAIVLDDINQVEELL